MRAAVTALERVLATPSPWMHRLTLAPGMGILCNNVLQDRSGFTDDPRRARLILRVRYHERIADRMLAAGPATDTMARR